MTRILTALLLLTTLIYSADKCSEAEHNYSRYKNMSASIGNLNISAKYMGLAIKYRKETLDKCFYSSFDKKGIRDEIKDMEEMKKDLLIEAENQRRIIVEQDRR